MLAPLLEMKSAPQASKTRPLGAFRFTRVASAPSTRFIAVAPVPAMVVMMPELTSTQRTRCPLVSAMYKRLPAASSSSAWGRLRVASVAAPPSPADPDTPQVPANLLMTPPAMSLTTLALESATKSQLRATSYARPRGLLRDAPETGPPSPPQWFGLPPAPPP